MIGLILLAIIVWFLFIKVLVSIFKTPPSPPVRQKFKAPLKRGTLTADVSYDPAHQLEIESALSRWAIRLENPQLPLEDALQAIIPATVISVAIERPDLPPQKPPKPTTAEVLVRNLKATDEAISALKEVSGVDLSIINGRSIELHREEYVKSKVVKLLYEDR